MEVGLERKISTAESRPSRARARAAEGRISSPKFAKALMLGLLFLIAAVDAQQVCFHLLYPHNNSWLKCECNGPFFYGLDVGDGKNISLESCPRSKLQQQSIKYLSPTLRNVSLVPVANKKSIFRLSFEFLDPRGPEDAKWTICLIPSKTLYVGQQHKGTFRHYSFLAGGAILCAVSLVVQEDILKAVWTRCYFLYLSQLALWTGSEYYRRKKKTFERRFKLFPKEHNVHISNVKALDKFQLPNDVIQMVADRLPTIDDLAAFSGVCPELLSVCKSMNWTSGPQTPWLMCSKNRNNSRRLSFFSLYYQKRYELDIPPACGRWCYGTAQGWIVAVDPDLQAYLFHPLHQDKIDLPALSALQNQVGALAADGINFIQKLIIFKDSRDQFQVMAICGPLSYLAYAKPGNSEWAVDTIGRNFKDVTFFGDHCYALCARGVLKHCYVPNYPEPYGLESQLVDFPPQDLRWQEETDKMYLVGSNGKLYAVFRYGSADVNEGRYKTGSFLVYKFQFNPDPDDQGWGKVTDLEDCAIFVGDCSSWSICASNNGKCKMNCIYFTDDNWGQQPIGGMEGHDIGVFDMASKKINYLKFGVDPPDDYPRPFWYGPTL